MDAPVTSPTVLDRFTPKLKQADGSELISPRTYLIAPLDWRQRIAYRAELNREAGHHPGDDVMMAALRTAVTASGAANAPDLLAAIDLAEAEPANKEAQVALDALKAYLAAAPAFAAIVAQRQRHNDTKPWIALRHALRGWDGPDLPEFRQDGGLVPFDVLAQLGEAWLGELYAAGQRADALAWLGPSAVGNSPSPSPSSETPAPALVH